MKRIGCLLLTVALLTGLSFSSNAANEKMVPAQQETLAIPAFINREEAIRQKHVKRLSKYEHSRNTIGFLNEDGTETAYLFQQNVRFQDADGTMKDKDNTIVAKETAQRRSADFEYENKANDVKMYFDRQLDEKGIQVAYAGHAVTMKPEQPSDDIEVTVKNQEDCSSITYDRAFGAHTSLVAYTGFNGYKEDIVLYRYDGVNAFAFIADFGGLTPALVDRGIELRDGEQTVFAIPPIYVKDSSQDGDESRRFTYDNHYELDPLPGGRYRVTVVADQSFLTDPHTVYPVTIDPTVTVPSGLIADAAVYSDVGSQSYGNAEQIGVGSEAPVGTGYVYASFNLSSLSNVRYDNIISAYYRCREMTDSTVNSIVECYLVYGPWSESSILWSNKPWWDSQKLCAVNVKKGEHNDDVADWYNFYITAAVQAWRQGGPNYGIMLKERTNASWKSFASSEHPLYPPSLVVRSVSETPVNYGYGVTDNRVYRLRNKKSGLYLTAAGTGSESNVQQETYNGSSNQKWRLNLTSNGYCQLTPQNNTSMALDLYCGSTPPSKNTNGANIQLYHKSTTALNQQWKFVRNWDGSYHILSRYCNDERGIVVHGASTASGANVVLYTISVNDYGKNDYWTLEPVDKGDADFYSFTGEGGYNLNTRANVDQVVGLCNQMGLSSYEMVNQSASDAYSYMPNDYIWYFNGHGNNSGVQFISQAGSSWSYSYIIAAGYNTSNEYCINQFSDNMLSKLYLSVYGGCNTGLDYSSTDSNLVGMTYKRGAHFVIGYSDYTLTNYDAKWMLYFFTSLKGGSTIYNAMNYADNRLYSEHTGSGELFGKLNQRHVMGDHDLILSHN